VRLVVAGADAEPGDLRGDLPVGDQGRAERDGGVAAVIAAEPGRMRRRRAAPSQAALAGRARFTGMITAADAAAVIGAPVPLWIEGTCTREALKRAQAYNATFTVPDTVTEWPATRDQVDAALQVGMPDRFPAGFAALASDALDIFARVQASDARQRDSGDGWHLAARPRNLSNQMRHQAACVVCGDGVV
jgi:hypothetical protein